MGSGSRVFLELPAELYERVRELAVRSNRTVEAVLLDNLLTLFGITATEEDEPDSILDSYSDDQLWTVVRQRLMWPDGDRLHELMARGRQAILTPAERIELEALLDQADRYTVWRARALWLLKQRNLVE